jgi:hypothetical protein
MIFIDIPKDTPFSVRRIELEGQDYYLTLEWSMRSGWYLGLADSSNVPIFAPRKLVADWDLLASCTDDRRPPGALLVIDMTGAGTDPLYDTLGEQHKLAYFTEAEK